MSTTYWSKRTKNANAAYEQWEAKFKCRQLEEYYEGFQWKYFNTAPLFRYNPYTLNLVGSTIDIKLASLIFRSPSFVVTARPGVTLWDSDTAAQGALLKQGLLNTVIQNPAADYVLQLKLAALDSFFRFGVMESGYSADWTNPNKIRPLTESHEDCDVEPDSKKDKVISDNPLPVSEQLYFKRIPASRFRVSASAKPELDNCDWCGYYDFYYKSQLQNIKGLKLPKDYTSGVKSQELGYISFDAPDDKETLTSMEDGEVWKVWHIWDNVAKKRILYIDGADEIAWETEFERIPLTTVRWKIRTHGWYPIPPVFSWLSPQDEINESREQQRSYRRRFTRKFQALKGAVSEDEKEKFASGPDGIIIEVDRENGISPIANPDIGPNVTEALVIAKDDFNIMSSTSSEARGQADSTTATQAKIVAARSTIRESAEQMDFSNFICASARELLLQAKEKLTLNFWVGLTGSQGMLEEGSQAFQMVSPSQIDDGYEFNIEVGIRDKSPTAIEDDKASFIEFQSILAQFPALALSPTLIREAANVCGYRNERVITEMQKAALLQMLGQASAKMQGATNGSDGGNEMTTNEGGNSNNMAKAAVAQASPNSTDQVANQLENQVMV